MTLVVEIEKVNILILPKQILKTVDIYALV